MRSGEYSGNNSRKTALTRVGKNGDNGGGRNFGVDVASSATNAMGQLLAADVVELLAIVVAEEGMFGVRSGVPFEELGDGLDLPRLYGRPGRKELGRSGGRHLKDELCLSAWGRPTPT